MTDELEEFEPLFDYTRVQPLDVVCLDDDDDDCSVIKPSKRRKQSAPNVEKVQAPLEAVVIDDGDDDMDWLKSPPKVPLNKNEKRQENSIIKELRLKKQELLSFTESTKDMVRTVEDLVKRDIKTLIEPECETPIEKPTKPAVERPKIVISIQDKEGLKQFRIYKDDKFERLFKMYADKEKKKAENLVFCFDGDKINPTTTPLSLDMEDEDIIEVNVKSS